MSTVVEHNGFHVPLDSPLAERLRQQDASFREGEEEGTLTIISADTESGEESTDYSKLKVAELDSLLTERGIEIPDGNAKKPRVELLEEHDAAEAEGGTLS